ncbi:MAG TPA: cytochrome c3 family protein [Terriglobales bacterium]|nr:cytochrome c3 family protein [Terriglobales bacterium]
MKRHIAKLLLVLLIILGFGAVRAIAEEAANVCIDCHSNLDAPLKVTGEEFGASIHAQKGLTCTACHGGNATDAELAMSPKAGFKGKPSRQQIPELCGKCHSDAAYVRQYNPSLRTDQLSQYHTSIHGKRLAIGDTKVAVCTDCHGIHDIRPPSDTRSSVHPLNVANTCKRCHADADYMKSYGIKTDQFAGYSESVHHAAMVERGDLSAPTCTTCHGNHGAAPPGVASVANVCSTCHVFQAQLFDESPHKAAFANMGFPGCVTCHSNHRIKPPSDSMLAGKDAVCTNCHTEGDAGSTTAQNFYSGILNLQASITRSEGILNRAADEGVEVGQAQLELTQARDALTKARVTIHSLQPEKVKADLDAGTKVTDKTYAAGTKAMQESRFRRVGLLVSLGAILFTVVALGLYIREREKNGGNSTH